MKKSQFFEKKHGFLTYMNKNLKFVHNVLIYQTLYRYIIWIIVRKYRGLSAPLASVIIYGRPKTALQR